MPPNASSATASEVRTAVLAYKNSHPGNGGKDWDVNGKTTEQLANDPEALALLQLCGPDQRPVIPLLAWEYGGADHRWIAPEMSALVYCVYTPVGSATPNWSWDPVTHRVTSDVYVLFPGENPCANRVGADQVAGCIGDPTNFEILVDIANYNDGSCASLMLAEASTELRLLMPDATKVSLYTAQWHKRELDRGRYRLCCPLRLARG